MKWIMRVLQSPSVYGVVVLQDIDHPEDLTLVTVRRRRPAPSLP